MFLVDANVLSEPMKPEPAASVVEWLAANRRHLVVNPIVLGELEFGILLLPAGRRRKKLLDWFARGLKSLRVLDFDADTAHVWANLVADLRRKGRAMPIKDSLIAATARQHQLTVATRNLNDYRHAGVTLIDPFHS